MSLILEALKKAERQHKLGEVPGLGASQIPEHRPAPRWLGLLLLVVVAGGMLTLGVYLGGGTPENETQGAVRKPAPRPLMEKTTEPQRPEEVPPAVQASKVEAQPTPTVARQSEPSQEVVAKEPTPEPPAEIVDLPPEEPKRLGELPTGFVDRLPKLNIDIHSYDKEGRRSYVLINLQKYREGDYLAEGPLLSEIRPDGVVLEHMGERFFLPIGNR